MYFLYLFELVSFLQQHKNLRLQDGREKEDKAEDRLFGMIKKRPRIASVPLKLDESSLSKVRQSAKSIASRPGSVVQDPRGQTGETPTDMYESAIYGECF